MNIKDFFHAENHITVYYYSKGDLKIDSIGKADLWKFIVKEGLHIADSETGELWEKNEFFKECELIVEAIIKQKWQNLVFKK